MRGLDKEIIRKHDYNHIYRAKQRQKGKTQGQEFSGSCPCIYVIFQHSCVAFSEEQTHIFVF